MEQRSNAFLKTEKIGVLMGKYAIPCIISLLVAALYNIVDQIFIANADYLGSYGNAANTVVFPLTVVALAVAVMIGDGCCAFVSISLGANRKEDAHKSIGSSILLCVISSLVVTALYLIFQEPLLTAFGGRVNEETFQYAKEYFFWITLGIPFYMFGQAVNPIIRSDGSPKICHGGHRGRRRVQHHLRPHLHLWLPLGYDGRGRSHCSGTDFDGGAVHLVSVPHESSPSGEEELSHL